MSFSACVLGSLDRPHVGYTTTEYRDYETIGGVVYPLRARLVMEATKVFDRRGAKSSPTLGTFGFLLWLDQRVLYQVGPDMLCIAIPRVGKISQGCPGVFSLANPLIGVHHGIDRYRQRWPFFVPVSVILCHEAQGFKFHGQPSLPKSWFRAFSIRIAHSSVAPLVRCTDPIPVELVYVSGSLFSEVV